MGGATNSCEARGNIVVEGEAEARVTAVERAWEASAHSDSRNWDKKPRAFFSPIWQRYNLRLAAK